MQSSTSITSILSLSLAVLLTFSTIVSSAALPASVAGAGLKAPAELENRAVCDPGTYLCVDPSRIRIDVCTSQGEWTPAAYCGYHQVCDVASNKVPYCRNNF